MKKTIGIYGIKNLITNTIYIGQSIEIEKRWRRHTWELNTNRHDNQYLQRAWNKYGANNFAFVILERCKKEELNQNENKWFITFYPNTYNLQGTGDRKEMSEETRSKLSQALKGIVRSQETREKMRQANIGEKNPFYHKHHTPEALKKIGEASKGRIQSKESIMKRAMKRRGQPSKLKGIPRPQSVIDKMYKKVNQYDMNWNFIRQWNSIKEAETTLGIGVGMITRACKNPKLSAHKYHWKYADKG